MLTGQRHQRKLVEPPSLASQCVFLAAKLEGLNFVCPKNLSIVLLWIDCARGFFRAWDKP